MLLPVFRREYVYLLLLGNNMMHIYLDLYFLLLYPTTFLDIITKMHE